MKKLIFLALLFLAADFAFAQGTTTTVTTQKVNVITIEDDDVAEYDVSKWLDNRIGGYGSFFSGYGLSFQHQFKNDFSLKSQIFAYGSNDDSEYNNDEIRLAWGVDLQYNLMKTRNTRLYVLGGTFVDYYETNNNYYVYPPNNEDYTNIERYINAGVGFGVEVMLWKHFSFALEGGYYGRFGNNTVTVNDTYGGVPHHEKQNPKSFGFGVGGGIFFAF